MELLGHMVVLFLVFWETTLLFSNLHLYQQCAKVAFVHIISNIVIFVVFDDSHFDRWVVIALCGFNLYFSDD